MAISEDIMPSNLVNIENPHPLYPTALPEPVVRNNAIASQIGNFQADSTLPENRWNCPRLDDFVAPENTR
jgi:hypothetical protein